MREVFGLFCMLVLLRGLVSKHLTDASISAPEPLVELRGSDQGDSLAIGGLRAAVNFFFHFHISSCCCWRCFFSVLINSPLNRPSQENSTSSGTYGRAYRRGSDTLERFSRWPKLRPRQLGCLPRTHSILFCAAPARLPQRSAVGRFMCRHPGRPLFVLLTRASRPLRNAGAR